MCFIYLDQIVVAVKQCRSLLDFVNSVAPCLRIRLNNLFDPLRGRNTISKYANIQFSIRLELRVLPIAGCCNKR